MKSACQKHFTLLDEMEINLSFYLNNNHLSLGCFPVQIHVYQMSTAVPWHSKEAIHI